MTARWLRLESLYHAAAALPASQRARFLDDACNDDPTLRGEVEAMLAREDTGFLDDPAGAIVRASESVASGPRLAPGTTLATYEVGALLGAGGMGEVYRARDTKLGRQVALKLLPASFTQDPHRLGRFRREAHVLATLNHPHIGAIYGLEEANGVQFLVLELIEGVTLAHRIANGPLPVVEALDIGIQIADALATAHEKGIVHRDLKPANIAVTADGVVKVLDFGLAKAVDPTSPSADAANSPTVTAPTLDGVILGTAAYMSPEQAAGKAVDKRSDVWAFGAVLMEMLTGRQVFTGDTVSHLLAAVLSKDPDWTRLPSSTPASIRTLLRRCLEKDRKRRVADASDVRLELDDARRAGPDTTTASTPRRTLNVWSHLMVGVVAATLAMAGVLAWRGAAREPSTPVYASLDAPAGYVLGEDDVYAPLPTRTPMVFTPDGRSLIIQAAQAGKPRLFLRSLDRPEARPIVGTDDGRVPFVSPDGKWVGFSTASELRKVPIEGGTPTTICPLGGVLGPFGAAWSAHDVIAFGDPESGRIMRVAAGGGTPAPVTARPLSRHVHVVPFFLPDGGRILFSDVSVLDAGDARLMVQALDGGDARVVSLGATDGRLLPSGQLVFMRLGTIMTVGFDLSRAEVKGDPVAVLGDVMQSGLRLRAYANNTGAGLFAVSRLGTLAVVRGPVTGGEEGPLIWVTRDGRASSAEPASGAPGGGRLYTRISPNGSRAIVTVLTPRRFEHWIADWTRNLWTRCAECSNGDSLAPLAWSPDGRRLLLPRHDTLLAHELDASTPDLVMVREAERLLMPAAWLADGRIVYTSYSRSPRGTETKLLDLGGHAGRVVVPLGKGDEPDVSPDGRWLAYTSTEAGQRTVVVQALTNPGVRTPVSADGGRDPLWSADGQTLYYMKSVPDRGGTVVYAADIVASGGMLTAGTPRELFHRPDPQTSTPRSYAVADGPRFLLQDRTTVPRQSVTRMDLVLNWTSTLASVR
jgi:serine/threonine protein kinase/Tol biopolymer transport system component